MSNKAVWERFHEIVFDRMYIVKNLKGAELLKLSRRVSKYHNSNAKAALLQQQTEVDYYFEFKRLLRFIWDDKIDLVQLRKDLRHDLLTSDCIAYTLKKNLEPEFPGIIIRKHGLFEASKGLVGKSTTLYRGIMREIDKCV